MDLRPHHCEILTLHSGKYVLSFCICDTLWYTGTTFSEEIAASIFRVEDLKMKAASTFQTFVMELTAQVDGCDIKL